MTSNEQKTGDLMMACIAILGATCLWNLLRQDEEHRADIRIVELCHRGMLVAGVYLWSVSGTSAADVVSVTLMAVITNLVYVSQFRPTYTGYVSWQIKAYGPPVVAIYIARLGLLCSCAYGWQLLLAAGIFGVDLHDRWIALKVCFPWLFPPFMRHR